MTKEQEKAIEYFKKHIKYFEEQIKFIEATECDYYDEELELYKNRVEQFKTVLSMLEEQDKIIDLMASEILNLDIKRANSTYDKARIWETEKGIKQYFENKAKEVK